MGEKLSAPRRHTCSRPGCNKNAECIPALVVPSHALAKNPKFQGCRSVLWLPLCKAHFSAASIAEFMPTDQMTQVRASVDADFRQNDSLPDWTRAAMQPVPVHDPEYIHYEQQWFEIEIQGRSATGRAN